MNPITALIVGIIIIMIIAAIGIFSVTQTTGSVIYGKCWEYNHLDEQEAMTLKLQGCIVEDERACCPFETCPETDGILC